MRLHLELHTEQLAVKELAEIFGASLEWTDLASRAVDRIILMQLQEWQLACWGSVL